MLDTSMKTFIVVVLPAKENPVSYIIIKKRSFLLNLVQYKFFKVYLNHNGKHLCQGTGLNAECQYLQLNTHNGLDLLPSWCFKYNLSWKPNQHRSWINVYQSILIILRPEPGATAITPIPTSVPWDASHIYILPLPVPSYFVFVFGRRPNVPWRAIWNHAGAMLKHPEAKYDSMHKKHSPIYINHFTLLCACCPLRVAPSPLVLDENPTSSICTMGNGADP